jgi:hypothetical protein
MGILIKFDLGNSYRLSTPYFQKDVIIAGEFEFFCLLDDHCGIYNP